MKYEIQLTTPITIANVSRVRLSGVTAVDVANGLVSYNAEGTDENGNPVKPGTGQCDLNAVAFSVSAAVRTQLDLPATGNVTLAQLLFHTLLADARTKRAVLAGTIVES